jgi:hypothetical protein
MAAGSGVVESPPGVVLRELVRGWEQPRALRLRVELAQP